MVMLVLLWGISMHDGCEDVQFYPADIPVHRGWSPTAHPVCTTDGHKLPWAVAQNLAHLPDHHDLFGVQCYTPRGASFSDLNSQQVHWVIPTQGHLAQSR